MTPSIKDPKQNDTRHKRLSVSFTNCYNCMLSVSFTNCYTGCQFAECRFAEGCIFSLIRWMSLYCMSICWMSWHRKFGKSVQILISLIIHFWSISFARMEIHRSFISWNVSSKAGPTSGWPAKVQLPVFKFPFPVATASSFRSNGTSRDQRYKTFTTVIYKCS